MSRRVWAIALVLAPSAACGDAGALHPFASGGASASGTADGGGSGLTDGASTGDTDGFGEGGALLYVRCPRQQAPFEVTADVIKDGQTVTASRTFHHADVYDVLPSALRVAGIAAPCDLVLRDDVGAESVIFDCASISTAEASCAAIDPAVSNDGRRIAFAVVHGVIERHSENVAAQALDPEAEPGSASTGATLPNPRMSPTHADVHMVDLVDGTEVIAAAAPGVLRRSPSFLHDGRVLFSSTVPGALATVVREGGGQASADASATDVFVMAPDGRDVQRLGNHAMNANRAPLQLLDGRVAVVSTQRIGLLPFRYTNGAPGSAGALRSSHHIYAQDPDGARYTALFGQHTNLVVGAFEHSAAVGLGQLGDGRVVFVEGGGPFGAGALRAFAPDPDGLEGPAPHTVEPADVFRPTDMVDLAPWAHGGPWFAAMMPEPPMTVPGYADPLAYAGFVRDPVAEPSGAMLVTWTKGACNDVATNDTALYGDPPPPATSGAYGLVPLNALEWLGRDNPGCDAGIYRAPTARIDHPSALEVVVDSPAFHEIMPRPVRAYAMVHGQSAPTPIESAHRRAATHPELPPATPFALLGGSSLLQHETRSVDGNAFGSELHWAQQGAQTSDWSDDEVCGVRISALMPNVPEDLTELYAAFGHRAVVLAEVPVRKFQGGAPVLDPLGDADTSFRVRVPADTPLLVGGLDCEGRLLSSSQVPFSLRPGEDRTCGGCHVRSQLPLRFDETAAAAAPPLLAGGGSVQLLAGGTPDSVAVESVDGFGATWEFERDVWPILHSRCVGCHEGDAAAAGLRLDLAGIESGSTWWRLAADYGQDHVPAGQQLPAGVLRKPQLSRYLRFVAARGSLLYWKAANARLDGRTDASLDADVDFGADHPSPITAAELRVIARWIDTGSAAGAAARRDTIAPVLVARIDPAAPSILRVGVVDVGIGVDPGSLTVEWRTGAGAWTGVSVPDAPDTVGTGTVTLDAVPPEAVLRVRVRDGAGNVASIEMSRSGLAGGW